MSSPFQRRTDEWMFSANSFQVLSLKKQNKPLPIQSLYMSSKINKTSGLPFCKQASYKVTSTMHTLSKQEIMMTLSE